MADNIEHQDKGELVTNCDQLQNDEVVVTTPVESRIMSIRGKQIMIDRDLAELYGVETKRLNEAVKRNIERFPERFRFQLTKEEMAELVANCDRFNSLKHSTVRSYAFTEQGVAMLSTVLALSDYKQLAAAAGYKPAPQLGRQTAIYHLGHNWRIFSL